MENQLLWLSIYIAWKDVSVFIDKNRQTFPSDIFGCRPVSQKFILRNVIVIENL